MIFIKNRISRPVFVIVFMISCFKLHSQVFFVKVTDPSNPIVTENLSGNYIGTSWVDVDNDERLDLFVCRKDIFKNLGNGSFVKLEGSIPLQGSVIGNSWADVDNDGDIDCFVVSSSHVISTSHLYLNSGNGMFTKVLTGQIADSISNSGWGCAWGDFNNDSYADLVIAAAFGFGGVNHSNRLFMNNGGSSFSRIDTTAVTSVNAPFTIPVWSDYDQDGDIDLFIGSGPATGTPARDFLYRNFRQEYNVPFYLQRIDTGVIGTDLVDGQNWNWIDIDTDGDLDAFLTNYTSTVLNRLYRCEGDHYYVKMTSAQAGTIVSDQGKYLANNWGDFDNDGDLDCFVTVDGGTTRYYSNNGSGFFTRIDTLACITIGQTFGATIGDYDNDGDLDLFVAGTGSTKALYRNETNNSSMWVNIRCAGSGPANNYSNRSAIGTIVRLKANSLWQTRDVSAQNSFNSMNMLNVHFGLGNASVIDSLVIKWPRGLTEVFTNITVNRFYKAVEGQGLSEVVIGISQISSEIPENFKLGQNFPNPFNPNTRITFHIPVSGHTSCKVFDITGKEITELVSQDLKPGTYQINWDASEYSSGVYFYRLESNQFSETRKMVLLR